MGTISQYSQSEKIVFSSQAGWKTFFQILAASGLISLCSQIKVDLPFTPIPLTLQTLAVMLLGANLGSRKSAWAILLYYAQILAGLPVLSGGMSDPLIFFGPKGGYVLGFFLQAYVMGRFVEKMPWSRPMTLLIGGISACGVQMALGICMLAQFVGWNVVWTMGLLPFLPGEILKILIICWGLNLPNYNFSPSSLKKSFAKHSLKVSRKKV